MMSVDEKLPSADMIEVHRCWVLDEGLVHSRNWTPEAAGSYETAASFPSHSCNPGISERTNKSLKLVFWQNFGKTAVLKSHTQKLLLNWKQHLPYSAWVCSWLQWEPDIPPDISTGELKPKRIHPSFQTCLRSQNLHPPLQLHL